MTPLQPARTQLAGHRHSYAPTHTHCHGSRVGELLRDGHGLLLDFDAHAPLQALADRWPGRLSYVTGSARDQLGLKAVLVRPDGFVAWATEDAPDPDAAAQAASRWCGKAG